MRKMVYIDIFSFKQEYQLCDRNWFVPFTMSQGVVGVHIQEILYEFRRFSILCCLRCVCMFSGFVVIPTRPFRNSLLIHGKL